MKKGIAAVAALMMLSIVITMTACGGKQEESSSLKNIERPGTAATGDEAADFSAGKNSVEGSSNVNGKRFNMTLKDFTSEYNREKDLRGESDKIFFGNWHKNDKVAKDDNDVEIQYWYYDDIDVSFTASVEVSSGKLVNIGCGTTMSKFMEITGDTKNSDTILGKAALMAQCVCGFPSGSEKVLQDIFYCTTTETDDSLWFKGYVFNLSTQEDKEDSKKNIMLFRVFPVTDELKNEWKLTEYKK